MAILYTQVVSSAVPADSPRVRALAPILVVGAPRSGTTLVQKALLADPRCVGGQESHFFASFGPALREFERKRTMVRPHGLACYMTRDAFVSSLADLWLKAFEPIVSAHPAAMVLIEKTPDHALWLDVAREVLPNARVLHVLRDSRAVVSSLLRAGRSDWGRAWAPRSIEAAIGIWRRHVECAAHSPLASHTVRFEEFVDDPARVLGAVEAFVGPSLAGLRAEEVELANPDRSTRRFATGGELGNLPDEPADFARSGDASRDGWRRELGFWAERRVWRETRDLLERFGYTRNGWERRR